MAGLTAKVPCRNRASLSQISAACVSTVDWLTSLFRSITAASYPNVMIRARGRSAGSNSWGQNILFFVQLRLRSPVRPWTNTTLVQGCVLISIQ